MKKYLVSRGRELLKDKYFEKICIFHYVATFLCPMIKELHFLSKETKEHVLKKVEEIFLI